MRRRHRRPYGGNREIVDYITANTRVTGPEVRTGQDIPSLFEFCRRNGYTDIACKWRTSPGNQQLEDYEVKFSNEQWIQIMSLPWPHPVAKEGDIYKVMNIYGTDALGCGHGYESSYGNLLFDIDFNPVTPVNRPQVLAYPPPTPAPEPSPEPTPDPTPSPLPTPDPTPIPVPDNTELVVSLFLWMYSGFEILEQYVFDSVELEKVVGIFNVRHVSGPLVKQKFLLDGQTRSMHLEGDLNVLATMRYVQKEQTPRGVCVMFSWRREKVQDMQMSCRIFSPLSWI